MRAFKSLFQEIMTFAGIIAFSGVLLFGFFLTFASAGVGPDALYQHPTFWSRLAGCVFFIVGILGISWVSFEDRTRHGELVDY